MSCERHIIGIDESGRGSLFGPVFVAGVSFNSTIESNEWFSLLNYSKKLSSKVISLIAQKSSCI